MHTAEGIFAVRIEVSSAGVQDATGVLLGLLAATYVPQGVGKSDLVGHGVWMLRSERPAAAGQDTLLEIECPLQLSMAQVRVDEALQAAPRIHFGGHLLQRPLLQKIEHVGIV